MTYTTNIGKRYQVLCADGKVRTAMVTGEATTAWTAPASVSVRQMRVSGQLYYVDAWERWCFTRSPEGKNAGLLPAWPAP